MKRATLWIIVLLSAFIATVCFALAFGWGLGAGLSKGIMDAVRYFIDGDQYQPSSEPNPFWRWVMDWLPQATMAVFTFLLWVVTRNQRKISSRQQVLLERADTKADTNIELTRKSIEAMVEANHIASEAMEQQVRIESGSFVFEAAEINEKGFRWAFRNRGRGDINPVIITIKFTPRPIETKPPTKTKKPTPTAPHTVLAYTAFIPHDGLLSTGGFEGYTLTPQPTTRLNTTIPDGILDDKPFIIEVEVAITCNPLLGNYQYEQRFVFHWVPHIKHLFPLPPTEQKILRGEVAIARHNRRKRG